MPVSRVRLFTAGIWSSDCSNSLPDLPTPSWPSNTALICLALDTVRFFDLIIFWATFSQSHNVSEVDACCLEDCRTDWNCRLTEIIKWYSVQCLSTLQEVKHVTFMNISNHYYIQYMKQAMTNFFFKRKTPTILSFTFHLYWNFFMLQ